MSQLSKEELVLIDKAIYDLSQVILVLLNIDKLDFAEVSSTYHKENRIEKFLKYYLSK